MPFCFFDLDGTILENLESFPAVFKQVLAEFGLPGDLASVERAIAATWPWYTENLVRFAGQELALWQQFNTRVGQTLGSGDRSTAIGRRITEVFTILDRPRLYDDALPCLEALARAGVRLGVLTARPDARRVLAPLLALDRFDCVLDAFTLGAAKQDAETYQRGWRSPASPPRRPGMWAISSRRMFCRPRPLGSRPC